MSKLIKGDTSLRYQLDDNNKGKFTESPYEFITCISDDGVNIIIQSNIDPNPQDLIIPYAGITSPTSANITELKEILWCWVLSKSRRPNDENGDPYILITPEVDPCFGVISNAACPYVLQNVGGTLYWDGSPIGGGGGGGFTTAESGVYPFNATTVRLGGTLLEDVAISGNTTWGTEFNNLTYFNVRTNFAVDLSHINALNFDVSNLALTNNLIRNIVQENASGNYSETSWTNNTVTTVVADTNTVDSSTNLVTPSGQAYSTTSGTGSNAYIQFNNSPTVTLSVFDSASSYNSNVVLNYNAFTVNAGLKLGGPQSVMSTPTLADDTKNIFLVSSNIGAFTLVLTFAMCEAGRIVIVKDIGNNASVNNITIDSAVGNIEGAATYVINTNRGSAMFVNDGANWWLI